MTHPFTSGFALIGVFGCTLVLRRRGERYVSTGLLMLGIAIFIGFLRYVINPELVELQGFVQQLAFATGSPLIAVQYTRSAWGQPGRDGRMNTMGASVVGFAMFSLAFQVDAYATLLAVVSMIVVVGAGITLVRTQPGRGSVAIGGALLWILAACHPVPGVHHTASMIAALALTLGLPSRSADW